MQTGGTFNNTTHPSLYDIVGDKKILKIIADKENESKLSFLFAICIDATTGTQTYGELIETISVEDRKNVRAIQVASYYNNMPAGSYTFDLYALCI